MRRVPRPDRTVMAVLPTGEVLFGRSLPQVLSAPGVAGQPFDLWIVPGRPEDSRAAAGQPQRPVVVVSLTPDQIVQVLAPAVDAIINTQPDHRGPQHMP